MLNSKILILIVFTALFVSLPLYSQPRVEFKFSNEQRAMAHNNIAVNFLKQKEYEKAIKEFEISLQYDPKNTNAYYNMGVAYFELNQYEKSIEYFEKLLSIKPGDATAYYHIAVSMSYMNKREEAINYYIKTLELKNDFVEARANLAMLYLYFDNKTKYNEQLAILEQQNPDIADMVKKAAGGDKEK